MRKPARCALGIPANSGRVPPRPGVSPAYGSSVSARPPSGTVTFLCTAIQDPLRRWDEAPADMAAAQAVHDRVVLDAIESHGGHVFLADTDGFRAAFATAGS